MTEKYIVINGNDIMDLATPVFNCTNPNEETYKNLLGQMQLLFNEFECTGNIKEPKYKNMEEIELKRAEQKIYDEFLWNFINPINRIEVQQLENGLYKPTDRYYKLYVAKKYGMKILVYLPYRKA